VFPDPHGASPAAVPTAVARILDANENRAGEGLRTIEDYFRFACNQSELAARCKQLRHELTTVLALVPLHHRLLARDASRDVGRHVSTERERVRDSAEDVLRANFKRISQALRSLEEWTKTQHSPAASALEQLRYRVYELESEWAAKFASPQARLNQARLYVLVDGADTPAEFAVRIEQLVAAKVGIIQLRDKRLPDRELYHRASLLRERTSHTGTLCVINDRVDVAVAVGADGVHLGQEDLPPQSVRRILAPGMLLGISTHSLGQAHAAVAQGASYIGSGPTFPSRTKKFAQFPGLAFLEQVADTITIPVFAIGGISLENLAMVQETGVSRVAVSSAIWLSNSPRKAAESFLNGLASRSDRPATHYAPSHLDVSEEGNRQ
jgi:thiamine-phosphate pyrophosphorylase